jgi:hypothetical protein
MWKYISAVGAGKFAIDALESSALLHAPMAGGVIQTIWLVQRPDLPLAAFSLQSTLLYVIRARAVRTGKAHHRQPMMQEAIAIRDEGFLCNDANQDIEPD